MPAEVTSGSSTPVAVARLHALWLAWQELTDPATCGHTGPGVWHRDHLDLHAGAPPLHGPARGLRQGRASGRPSHARAPAGRWSRVED
ncbi:DUF4913 domain-containing protein [Streptomyces xanthophaeus]